MKKHSSMALVVFAVCMVSYSGPMVKGALNEGASPISVALLRMLAAALLMLPYEARQCVRRHIPMKLTPAQWGLTALAAAFLAAHYITWITSLTGTSTFASVALVCTQPLFVAGPGGGAAPCRPKGRPSCCTPRRRGFPNCSR